MKILLTGKNKSGKTTLLESLIGTEHLRKGFVTREVRGQHDRIGFDLIDHKEEAVVLARIDSKTRYQVGRAM